MKLKCFLRLQPLWNIIEVYAPFHNINNVLKSPELRLLIAEYDTLNYCFQCLFIPHVCLAGCAGSTQFTPLGPFPPNSYMSNFAYSMCCRCLRHTVSAPCPHAVKHLFPSLYPLSLGVVPDPPLTHIGPALSYYACIFPELYLKRLIPMHPTEFQFSSLALDPIGKAEVAVAALRMGTGHLQMGHIWEYCTSCSHDKLYTNRPTPGRLRDYTWYSNLFFPSLHYTRSILPT
jgi:hypothetical protein